MCIICVKEKGVKMPTKDCFQTMFNRNSDGAGFAYVNADGKTVVKKTICGPSYSVTLYGKRTRFNVPAFSGQWGTEDGVTLTLLRSEDKGESYTVECGSTETESQTLGTNGTQKKGCFNNLGAGKNWYDYSYTGKTSTGYYRITDGTNSVEKSISSDRDAVTIQKD